MNNFFAVTDVPKPLTHKDALKLVCAVCVNLRGTKAKRGISALDESRIQKFVFSGFQRASPYSPQGLCEVCHSLLKRTDGKDGDSGKEVSARKKVEIVFLLPEDYHCELPHDTRSQTGKVCSCRWCTIARLYGGAFKAWQVQMREQQKGRPAIRRMCHQCGKGILVNQKSHSCNSADKAIVANMLQSIPASLKPKLAHSLLKELKADQEGNSTVHLTPAGGGRALPVTLGSVAGTSTNITQQISVKDLIQSGSKNHLSGAQLASQAADLRAVLGHKVVEPGLQKEIIIHNNRLAPSLSQRRWPSWGRTMSCCTNRSSSVLTQSL